MHRLTAKAVFSLAVSANLSILLAATSAIGVVTSNGNIILNDAKTAANATVFDGSTLQTERAASQVRLNNGARVQLGSDSRGKLYSDRVVLEKGSAKIDGYSANANGLKITTDPSASASVTLQGAVVQVAALTGNVHVYNAYGVNVANLVPGKALNLTPQDAGASASTTMIGVINKSGSAYVLTDETSNVTVELRGTGLRDCQRVQVTGTPVSGATAAGGASQVIQVTNVKTVGGARKNASGMCTATGGAGAGAAGAGAAAAGAAAAGISATTAVIAGVAAAAVVGTAAGVAASSSNNSGTTTTLSAGRT